MHSFFFKVFDSRRNRGLFFLFLFSLCHLALFEYGAPALFNQSTFAVYLFLAFAFWFLGSKHANIESFFRKHHLKILGLFIVIACCLVLGRYGRGGGWHTPLPWMKWFDQSSHYLIYDGLSGEGLNKNNFYMGIGYAVLAHCFGWWFTHDPFLPTNLLCLAITLGCFHYICLKIFKSHAFATLCTGLFVCGTYLTEYLSIPWSSTVTLMSYVVVLALILRARFGFFELLIMSLASGLMFMARYVDLLLVIPVWCLLIVKAFRSDNQISKFGLITACVVMAAMVGYVFYWHNVAFGSYFATPYGSHSVPNTSGWADDTPDLYRRNFGIPILAKLYGEWIETRSTYFLFKLCRDQMETVFQKNLIFYFFPVGLLLLWQQRAFSRMFMIAISAGALFFVVFYGMHPGTGPGSVRYHSAHYFRAVSILFFIGGATFIFNLFKSKEQFIYCLRGGLACILFYGLTFLVSAPFIPRYPTLVPAEKTFLVGDSPYYNVVFLNLFGQPAIERYIIYPEVQEATLEMLINGEMKRVPVTKIEKSGQRLEATWFLQFPQIYESGSWTLRINKEAVTSIVVGI